MPAKILIVEDDRTISEMYKLKLELVGFAVGTAFDGREGLRLAESYAPDLILLDLRMPVMGGDEMLERMRATEWGSQPRVIVLTNISKDEAPMNLRLLSVDRYVVKAHHTPQQVVEVILEILGEDVAKA
jgi:DNA-binding response OmpR family regulator